MLKPTRYSGLWLVTVAMLCMGLAPALHAGAESEKQAAHQAAAKPAKPAAAKPAAAKPAAKDTHAPAPAARPAAAKPAATAKAAGPAQASAVDVVKRIQSVLAKEQAKPADRAAGGHAASPATHAAPKAPRPKPAPLLRWVGMPRPGDVTLTWDPAIRPGAAETPGVRLIWPADSPDAVQK